MRQVVVPTMAAAESSSSSTDELPGSFLGELLDRVYVERRNEQEAQHSLKKASSGRPR